MRKILILISAAILIAILMPSRGIVSLQPPTETEWSRPTVIAPFDIPLYKSEQQIQNQTDRIISSSKPVFNRVEARGQARVEGLMQVISTQEQIDSISLHRAGELLSEIYQIGILHTEDYNKYSKRPILLSSTSTDTLTTQYGGGLYSIALAVELLVKQTGIPEDLILPYVDANLVYNQRLSDLVKQDALSLLSQTEGVVRKGEIVVERGQIIDAVTLHIINSYNKEMESSLTQSPLLVLLTRFIIVFIILLINYLYFTRFSVHYLGMESKKLAFVLVIYLFAALLMGITVNFSSINPLIVPIPIIAIYLLTFFNLRVAIMGNITAVLICSMFISSPYDYLVINIISGMIAIFMMRHYYHRGKLMRALGGIIISQAILTICFALLQDGELIRDDYFSLIWIVFSALLFLGLYQLIYFVETIFGFVSDITLLELCDTNQPLLMKLAQSAPGTFQHSVQVANLAESAAKEIGANPLLARTGALYHDIGKISNPFFFVENLSGSFNPHNDLTPYESRDIIKSHVSYGLSMAKKYKLPATVQDFISQHHGESLIYYFYDKAKKTAQEGEEVDPKNFRYDGPKPISREVSICMMADAIEAASRSLQSYEAESLENLVDSIIDGQIKDGQFSNSLLTFEEVGRVKALLKAKLNNIYHGRIAYPSRKE